MVGASLRVDEHLKEHRRTELLLNVRLSPVNCPQVMPVVLLDGSLKAEGTMTR